VSAGEGERRVTFQCRVAACRVVVGLKLSEFAFKIPRIPEQHMIEEFSPYRPDQAFHERV